MNFADRMKEIIRKSLENKKKFSEQAPEKANGFGQKGILYDEIDVLEKDIEDKFLIIGNKVYSALMKEKQSNISKDTMTQASPATQIIFLLLSCWFENFRSIANLRFAINSP